jgi:hypothetical protein
VQGGRRFGQRAIEREREGGGQRMLSSLCVSMCVRARGQIMICCRCKSTVLMLTSLAPPLFILNAGLKATSAVGLQKG